VTGTERDEGLAWQTRVWDRVSGVYRDEIEQRLAPVGDAVIARAELRQAERVLDLGTGTGVVAERAARVVGSGHVVAVDISPEMVALAEERARKAAAAFEVRVGSAEAIPAPDDAFDVVLASLSLMFAVDRGAAAGELARVLRSGGRLVASVWGGAEESDLVRFQRTVGRFAPEPPVPGVGPDALADPTPFVGELARVGIETRVESETFGCDLPDLDTAWNVFAGVTAAAMTPERQAEARQAIQDAMWPEPEKPLHFTNRALFLVGNRR
jgi:SAM-dependent methyltransferase